MKKVKVFESKVNENADDYSVISEGGSIGSGEGDAFYKGKSVKVVKKGIPKDEATETKDRMNKALSKGEKEHYKMKYSAVETSKLKWHD